MGFSVGFYVVLGEVGELVLFGGVGVGEERVEVGEALVLVWGEALFCVVEMGEDLHHLVDELVVHLEELCHYLFVLFCQ
jgi:hypothetical protein